ncbi:heterocycloanthracin/sonorensin family bacteriocin, partial [Klebsiella pneumoniae]|nr:heterocycloanthracin/sonorensin family bacteriocin [Klebsiella pneumoniae]
MSMQYFHDELQSLGMDHFHVDEMTAWDPNRHEVNAKHCASCWSCGSCASCASCASCWSCASCASCWSCASCASCWSCAS